MYNRRPFIDSLKGRRRLHVLAARASSSHGQGRKGTPTRHSDFLITNNNYNITHNGYHTLYVGSYTMHTTLCICMCNANMHTCVCNARERTRECRGKDKRGKGQERVRTPLFRTWRQMVRRSKSTRSTAHPRDLAQQHGGLPSLERHPASTLRLRLRLSQTQD